VKVALRSCLALLLGGVVSIGDIAWPASVPVHVAVLIWSDFLVMARALGVGPEPCSLTIASLVRKGWIERRVDPSGAHQFRITQDGGAALPAEIRVVAKPNVTN
jgi:hypothetical protein